MSWRPWFIELEAQIAHDMGSSSNCSASKTPFSESAGRSFGRPADGDVGVMDFEEHSLDAEEQRVGFSVLELTSRTVQGIETALQRLEAGEFGTCSYCRCGISDARLRVLPFAALCRACQERHDIAAGWRERVASARTRSLGH